MTIKVLLLTATLLAGDLALGHAPVLAQTAGAAAATAAQPAPWREKLKLFAQASFKHPAWGYSHSLRIYNLSLQLAAADKAVVDDDVLFAAALLHDAAAFPAYAKKDVDHADRAVELAEGLLRDTGFPMAKLPKVQAVMRTHMFFREPAGPEALYFHDADSLDWLGAIGIARVTATVDLTGTIIGGVPDGPAVVRQLQAFLQAVPPRILSPAGKAMLPERRVFLERYLSTLAAQTDDFKTL
ncbi:HD domain-containing protein [Sandarakinorhabdus cyanobacteriorum]|nr:HD domain-containing protein [Sandarakinorhabdus cyanobacteriorum]